MKTLQIGDILDKVITHRNSPSESITVTNAPSKIKTVRNFPSDTAVANKMSVSSRTYAGVVTGQVTQTSTEKVNLEFKTTQVKADGDCLFHSLDIILRGRGISTSAAELRKNIAHLGLVTSEQHLNQVYGKTKARLLWLDMANKGVWDNAAGDQILAIASQYIVISKNSKQ